MKCLTLILVLYMLTLACMPCKCADEALSDCTEQAQGNAPSEEESHDDSCTPFCTCSCCHATVANGNKPTLSDKKPTEFNDRQTFALAAPGYSSYHCHNIWQPPKLN